MSDDKLREAFELMKAGNKPEARNLIREVLKADGKNDRAWWMLVHLLDDDEKKRRAAERVLELNPDHAGALRFLQPAETKVNDEKKKKRGDYDWSKLEQREREGFNHPESVTSKIAKRALGFIVGAALLMFLPQLASFIFNYVPVPDLYGLEPDEVVITQMTAAFNGDLDTMRELTCDSLEDEWEGYYRDLERDLAAYNVSNFGIDLSGMRVEYQHRTARRVVLELYGEFAIFVEGERVTMDIQEMLVSEGGREDDNKMIAIVQNQRWVVCSL